MQTKQNATDLQCLLEKLAALVAYTGLSEILGLNTTSISEEHQALIARVLELNAKTIREEKLAMEHLLQRCVGQG